MYVVIVKFSS